MNPRKISALSICLLAACMALPAAAQTTVPTVSSVEYPGGQGWHVPTERYGVVIVDNVKIPMDDGVELVATIAYPADLQTGKRAEGRFPVLIEHMPYAHFAVPLTVNSFFAKHGYISVFVRARGTGASGGEVQFLSPREGRDGANLIQWAAKIDGADGNVAIHGCSWPGAIALTDTAYAGKNSPLKAVLASCSGMENMPRQSWLNGGMPTMSFWQFKGLGTQLVGDTPAVRRFFQTFTQNVISGRDAAYQGKYWGERGTAALAEKIVANNIPVLLNAGWRDVVETGAVRAYLALQNAYAKRPVFAPMTAAQPVSPRWQLVMGGWEHGQGMDMGLHLQWLDTWVKGRNTGLQHTQTPLHAFEMGSNRWVNLKGYPQTDSATVWYLSANGNLTTDKARQGRATLRYAQPSDVDGKLSYTTNVLKDGATLSGAMTATIYAKSSNRNMVLIPRLYDVAPDGSEQLISRGALVGSQRALDNARTWRDSDGNVTWAWQAFKHDSYLTPDKTYRFDIALAPRQWGVQPGHRLRFELSSQTPADLCPADKLPPKNDSEPCLLTKPQQQTVPGGVYTVLYGGNTPSAVNLPQLAYQAQPAVRAGRLALPWNENSRRIETGKPANNGSVVDNLLPTDSAITHPLVW